MIPAIVELSGEAPALARAEARAAAEALGGAADPSGPASDVLVGVQLPSAEAVSALAFRLALARRCLREVAPDLPAEEALATEGRAGHRAVIRRIGGSPGGSDDAVRSAGAAYRRGGGRIDLEHPERRYFLAPGPGGSERLFLEVAAVDRPAAARRRMPLLPFRRPIALAPRLARAAANLARVRPGDRVVDPFLGTGALLAEAGLLGARTYGIDRDAEMVRGALQNFRHLGVEATALVAGDAAVAELAEPTVRFDALLTDPPYGRASGTGGEAPDALLLRVLPRWAARVRPGGRVVVVVPEGAPDLAGLGDLRTAERVRVHRSLTREFRAYDRPRDG